MDLLAKQYIENYIKRHASSTIISRGKSALRDVKMIQLNTDIGIVDLTVKSQSYGNSKYKVRVTNLGQSNMDSQCSCPYDMGGVCKHEVASLYFMMNYMIDHPIGKVEPKKFKMQDCVAENFSLDDGILRGTTTAEIWAKKASITIIKIESALNGVAECHLTFKKEDFVVKFHHDTFKPSLQSSCSCNKELPFPHCEHKIAALLKIREVYGPRGFKMMKNWEIEKSKLLAQYGFSESEKYDDKFEFKIKNESLEIIKKDPSIQKLSDFNNWKTVGKNIFQKQKITLIELQEKAEDKLTDFLYILKPIDLRYDRYAISDFSITTHTHKYNPKTNKITHIREFDGVFRDDIPEMDEATVEIMNTLKRISRDSIIKAASKSTGANMWYTNLNEEQLQACQEVIGKNLALLMPLLAQKKLYGLLNQNNNYYKSTNTADELTSYQIDSEPKKPIFYLKEDSDFIILDALVEINNKMLPLSKMPISDYFWLFKYGSTIYKWSQYSDAAMVDYLKEANGSLKVKKSNFEGFFNDFILPLTDNFEVDFQLDRPLETKILDWVEGRVYLKEQEENLIIVPAFAYQTEDDFFEFDNDGRSNKVEYDNGLIQLLERNTLAENELYAAIQQLHPTFESQTGQNYFSLPYKEVMKDTWFFKLFDALKEMKTVVFGTKDLRFKYNTNRPSIQTRTSSGIDWFDMEIEVQFGEQFASLKDIRKAVMKKQNYVELKDGSLGILPEDWLQKYANLFKFGQIKGEHLQISKLHFTIIEELLSQTDSGEILRELQEKKQKLLDFKKIKDVAMPANIKADLREYQFEGYKWMNFLDEFSWGGILADDMGLGKTLQMLTFLQEQKNRFPNSTNLVVVPTSLIFNWQAEVDKFCPNLKVFVYHGQGRTKDVSFFAEYDIILTTYGTLRSDIELFITFMFHYIILDESQAIKNPGSLISKAVRLLKAKNRLVMTGTPIENNTFDLYSQFEFINPGLLGTEEFFKTEFANPIDKNQDPDAMRALRKITYPFMLKRTKEEVAKDLPDKTETILFCEMGKKQRKVYDTVRQRYRTQLENKFETEGKEKSGMLILEALLKLRQICDSPLLLSEEGEFTDESVKLTEIIREIEENASNHKILIFSQFLKMLALVRDHLDKNNIVYEYLDGSTKDRAARVKRFQNDKSCRVFLVSLKAGGVGLNLTEADYVYLIDPWWNPAVENQAIDRTHRIGQTRKVFAYKMICKDTVEEKILQLQARKKDLANDLVGAEAGFIKKLSKADILDLFS